jgi:ubiquinone biosynthesis protein COQ9
MAKKARDAQALKDRIFEAALPDVVFDGWTDALLDKAARRLKVPAGAVRDAFPGGGPELAAYFSDSADARALKKLKSRKLADMRVRDRIALGVRLRLEVLEPYRPAVSSALAALSLPPRSLSLPKMVWRTADGIWRAAGDTATDYNYYTKRLLLAGVLTSTTLYWLNDESEGRAESWKFLDRRIEEVLKVGKKISSLRGRGAARA